MIFEEIIKQPKEKISIFALGPHLGPKMDARWPQDGPKRASRWPQEGPRCFSRGLGFSMFFEEIMAPRWPQEDPRWTQRGPRWLHNNPRTGDCRRRSTSTSPASSPCDSARAPSCQLPAVPVIFSCQRYLPSVPAIRLGLGPQEGLEMAPRGPKMFLKRSKMAPRCGPRAKMMISLRCFNVF